MQISIENPRHPGKLSFVDNLTHGLVGASLARVLAPKSQTALWASVIASELPDLDVLIHSQSDPMVGFEYHRHFTHALAFVPIGAILAAVPFFKRKSSAERLKLYLICVVAYLSHSILDLCTSYGTQLLRPFGNVRLSLDWISIVDPVVIILLAAGLFLGGKTEGKSIRICGALAVIYFLIGAFQHHRAVVAQERIAQSRGHKIEHGRAMPTLANLIVWRSLYAFNSRMYADGIRLPLGRAQYREGSSIEIFQPPKEFPGISNYIERFRWFTDGFIALSEPLVIGDMRYSAITSGFAPLWGIKIDPPQSGRAFNPSIVSNRRVAGHLWSEIFGLFIDFKPVQ